MRNDSSLNYNTKYSKIQNYKYFEEYIRKEKDSLKKIKRGYKTNKDGDYNLPNVDSDKLKYNKITHKTDNNFGKEIVSDFIHSLDDEVKDTDQKYKLEKEQDKAKMEGFNVMGQNPIPKEKDFSNDSQVTSYMFFGNLQTIHRLASELYELDEEKVNELLNDGHNWAEDHITSAKVQIGQVYNFFMNKPLKENHDGYNYMFFANLESIIRLSDGLLDLDEEEVDQILMSGHDWAEDHISSAKENIEQVHDFLQNELR
jgi:hypothetical protein